MSIRWQRSMPLKTWMFLLSPPEEAKSLRPNVPSLPSYSPPRVHFKPTIDVVDLVDDDDVEMKEADEDEMQSDIGTQMSPQVVVPRPIMTEVGTQFSAPRPIMTEVGTQFSAPRPIMTEVGTQFSAPRPIMTEVGTQFSAPRPIMTEVGTQFSAPRPIMTEVGTQFSAPRPIMTEMGTQFKPVMADVGTEIDTQMGLPTQIVPMEESKLNLAEALLVPLPQSPTTISIQQPRPVAQPVHRPTKRPVKRPVKRPTRLSPIAEEKLHLVPLVPQATMMAQMAEAKAPEHKEFKSHTTIRPVPNPWIVLKDWQGLPKQVSMIDSWPRVEMRQHYPASKQVSSTVAYRSDVFTIWYGDRGRFLYRHATVFNWIDRFYRGTKMNFIEAYNTQYVHDKKGMKADQLLEWMQQFPMHPVMQSYAIVFANTWSIANMTPRDVDTYVTPYFNTLNKDAMTEERWFSMIFHLYELLWIPFRFSNAPDVKYESGSWVYAQQGVFQIIKYLQRHVSLTMFEDLLKYYDTPKDDPVVITMAEVEPSLLVQKNDRRTCEHMYKQYKQGRLLGQGTYGHVYSLCDPHSCPYVLKVTRVQKRDSVQHSKQRWEKFQYEIQLQQKAAERGLAPRVHDIWYCIGRLGHYFGFAVLDKMEGDLDKVPQVDYKQIYRLVQDLHKIGIEHGDLKLNNFLFDRSGRYYLNDFGFAREHSYTFMDQLQLANPRRFPRRFPY